MPESLYSTNMAYNHLVHQLQNKDLVCSLVQHHKDYLKQNDNVIAGKGQPLFILLSGPPGTGKTFNGQSNRG